MLKLKLQYFGHLMRRVDSLEKTLMLGGIEGRRRRGRQRIRWAGWHHRLNGNEFEWTPGVGDGQGGLACCDSWGRKESDTTKWLNWTDCSLCIFNKKMEEETSLLHKLFCFVFWNYSCCWQSSCNRTCFVLSRTRKDAEYSWQLVPARIRESTSLSSPSPIYLLAPIRRFLASSFPISPGLGKPTVYLTLWEQTGGLKSADPGSCTSPFLLNEAVFCNKNEKLNKRKLQVQIPLLRHIKNSSSRCVSQPFSCHFSFPLSLSLSFLTLSFLPSGSPDQWFIFQRENEELL